MTSFLSTVSTSKIFLAIVLLAGIVLVFMKPNTEQLIAYGVLLVGVVYNRIDSRNKSYKFSAGVGNMNVSVEVGKDDGNPLDSAEPSVLEGPKSHEN